MAWLDIVLLAIIVVSTLVSLIRGFIREVLSLAAWILAFWVSIGFADRVAPSLMFMSESDIVRLITAFVVLFLVTLIAAALVNHLISLLVTKTGLSGTDRVVGMMFGLVRGVALIAVAMVVGLVAGVDAEAWWQASKVVEILTPLAEWMRSYVGEV